MIEFWRQQRKYLPRAPIINKYYNTIFKQVTDIWLPAEAAYLPIDNPATLTEQAGSTIYGGHSFLGFNDTVAKSAIWRVPIPKYNGGDIIITAYSKVETTPSSEVTLQFDISTIGLANGEEFESAITVDTNTNISYILNTTESNTDIMISSATINPGNVSANDMFVFELTRDVANDTLVDDGEIVGIMIEYTRL